MKLSLSFCLLAFATADSDKAVARNIFARQIRPSIPPPSVKDFQNLYNSLWTKFITRQNIPKYVRMSFHDLLNFDSSIGSTGARGCILDDKRIANFRENNGLGGFAKSLKSFVQKEFPSVRFSSGGTFIKKHIDSFFICRYRISCWKSSC